MDQNGLSCVQVARAHNLAVFDAFRELDFEKDPFGSLGQLICEKRNASGSDNASAGVNSDWLTGNGTTFAGNSSGRSLKRWRLSCLVPSSGPKPVFFPTLNELTFTTTSILFLTLFGVSQLEIAVGMTDYGSSNDIRSVGPAPSQYRGRPHLILRHFLPVIRKEGSVGERSRDDTSTIRYSLQPSSFV